MQEDVQRPVQSVSVCLGTNTSKGWVGIGLEFSTFDTWLMLFALLLEHVGCCFSSFHFPTLSRRIPAQQGLESRRLGLIKEGKTVTKKNMRRDNFKLQEWFWFCLKKTGMIYVKAFKGKNFWFVPQIGKLHCTPKKGIVTEIIIKTDKIKQN